MDDRQTKIRAGAGLEESRINTELVDFLNKWSSPVLIVIGLIGLGWFGLNYMQRAKVAKLNNAFAAYESTVAGGNPSPASLRNIATEYAGVGAVGELALLRTVDLYLRAAISGVEPGAELDPMTRLPVNETDLLDADRARGYLSQARDLSRQVAQSTERAAGRELIRVQALMRLGAAEEGLGQIEQAKAAYARAGEVARAAGFPELGLVADARAERAGTLTDVPSLPARASLPALPGERFLDAGGDLPLNFEDLMSIPMFQNLMSDPEGQPEGQPEGSGVDDPGADGAGAGGADPGAGASGTP